MVYRQLLWLQGDLALAWLWVISYSLLFVALSSASVVVSVKQLLIAIVHIIGFC